MEILWKWLEKLPNFDLFLGVYSSAFFVRVIHPKNTPNTRTLSSFRTVTEHLPNTSLMFTVRA